MSLSRLTLPDDDSGPEPDILQLFVPKATTGSKVPRPPKRRGKHCPPRKSMKLQKSNASAAVQQDAALPSDDDGPMFSDSATSSMLGATTPVASESTSTSGATILRYDDVSLKKAASKIPSHCEHPFHDLKEILQNLKPFNDKGKPDTLWELFSLPRLQPKMIEQGGRSTRSYDIRHFWDLGNPALARTVFQDLAILQPLTLFLSPPCTWVSQLQHSNWARVAPAKRVLSLKEACDLIDTSMWFADHQVLSGNLFGFEHPHGSLAWERDSVTQQHLLLTLPSSQQNLL